MNSIINPKCKTFSNPCRAAEIINERKKKIINSLTLAKKCCDEDNELFKEMEKYFSVTNNTLKDLLICLKEIYTKKKKENINFRLCLCGSSIKDKNPNKLSFIEDFFPRDNAVGTTNFKRQHVFEAICKLILLFGYDNSYYGKEKEFYKSLEGFTSSSKNIEVLEQILGTKINAGSSAGSVDIFFRKKEKGEIRDTNEWSCEKKEKVDTTTDKFILVQNKYYTNEFADIDKYDYSKILRKAQPLIDNKVVNFKIVLMVNNSNALSDKLKIDAEKEESLEILENDKLEEWFINFLIDLESKSLEEFIWSKTKRKINTIQPRFHQELFIETTNEYLNKPVKDRRKKFIWGAVPRSGKSYMIAGMISKRSKTTFNDVILILGAKTETQSQFVDIFEKKGYVDFEDYGIIYDGNKKSGKKSKNIYLFSQEKFKANNANRLSKDEKVYLNQLKKREKAGLLDKEQELELKILNERSKQKEFRLTDNTKKKFTELIKSGNHVDIYFDEIHKGGSTDKSREILKSFENEKMDIDLFVMVTATFAKPNIAYEEFMSGYTPIILEWNYEDQQLMKNIDTNSVNMDLIKFNRNKLNKSESESDFDNTEYDVINRLFDEYNYKYGENYKEILAKQYKHHPELVLINPSTLDIKDNPFDFSSKDITDHFLKLKCSAIDYTDKSKLNDYTNIFQNSSHVDELLKLIGDFNSDKLLSKNCLYDVLKEKFNYDFTKKTTQLWFLPTMNLFNEGLETDGTECEVKYPPSLQNTHRHGDNISEEIKDEDSSYKKKGKPHIEPLTRGVALALMNNSLFKKYFNVIIIHTNGELYKLSDLEEAIYCVCIKEKGRGKDKSIVDKIKEFETLSYEQGKGLIILTGTILRLGVSLPCVDLAINFDKLSSLDLNYQTMFRVLTESSTNREKKYGYYVDLNKDRSIKFIYEYTQVYSNKLKTSKTIEDLADAQQNILQLFNFNGLTFSRKNIEDKLRLYSKMVRELKLDVETLRNKYMNNFQETVGKLILKINNLEGLYDLNKKINIKFKNNSFKINKEVEKGTKKQKAKRREPEEIEKNNTIDEEDEMEVEEEISQLEIQKNMKAFLPGIVFMLAFFSQEYECMDLEMCLKNAIMKIDSFEDTLCQCKNKENFFLACYFDKFRNPENKYKKEEFKKILIDLHRILFETDTYSMIRNSLIIFYDSIIKSFNMSNNIMKGGSKTVAIIPKRIHTKKVKQQLIFTIYNQDKTPNKENFNKWIEDTIYKFLPIRDEAKDKHGEVFTPKELINEMMDQLNKIDPSVFTNKNLKWLDPANGTGNFPLIVYGRLMNGLEPSIPDEAKRSQHILQNMLYMVELQPDNYEISRKIFGREANIFCGSFLTPDNKSINPQIAKKFGVEKYDIIMGNPPFNKEKKGAHSGSTSNTELWLTFSMISIDKLKDNGFLLFIHPQNWRGLGPKFRNLWETIKKLQLHFLHIYNKNDGKKYFNAGTRFDLYILQKKLNFKKSIILDEKSKLHQIDLKKFNFLPNYNIKKINEIITDEKNGINVIYDTKYHTQKPKAINIKEWWMKNTDKPIGSFKHPVVHTITLKGLGLWHTNDKTRGHFYIKKVLLNKNENQYPYNDYEGAYGMSQVTFGLPITSKKEGDLIVKAINTPDFKEIIKATKWGAFETDWRMFKYFKKDFWKEFVDENGNPLHPEKPPNTLDTVNDVKTGSNAPKKLSKKKGLKLVKTGKKSKTKPIDASKPKPSKQKKKTKVKFNWKKQFQKPISGKSIKSLKKVKFPKLKLKKKLDALHVCSEKEDCKSVASKDSKNYKLTKSNILVDSKPESRVWLKK